MERLGMIGGGAMGSALLKGIVKQGLVKPEEIFLVEPDVTKRETLQTELGINIKNSPAELAAECPVMILAVKPGVIPGVLKELGSKADRSHLVISIAAGVTLASLSSELNKARLVRVMPNTPARISRGVTVYCLGPNTNPSDAEIVAAIFECVGTVLSLPETQLDAVTAISGSGPAYVYHFMESWIDAGVMLGLTRDVAQTLVTETILGTAELLKTSGEHPAKLRNDVTSPGGTTAAGLFELEKGAFTATLMKAVLATAERSRELGKKA